MTHEPNPRDPLTMGTFGYVNKLTTALGDLIRAGWPADELAAEYRKQQRAYEAYRSPGRRPGPWAPLPSIDSIKKALRDNGTSWAAETQLCTYRVEA